MNKELKAMILSALAMLLVLIVAINVFHYSSNNYISEADRYSQQMALNRLRHPHLSRSSEFGKYPMLKNKQHLKLIAVRKSNRLYVTNSQKVIYVVNAQINHHPTVTTINAARGEQVNHVNSKTQSTSINWTNFGKLGYIESPTVINNHRIHGNWLQNSHHVANTIEVSKPDAKWLQQLPANTKLIIK